MSKDNNTPNRVQVVWNMIGGDAAVDDLLTGKCKLCVVPAGVVEQDKGNRVIIDTLEEARAVVRSHPLSSFQQIGCLTVIQPSIAGKPRSSPWCDDTIALVWMLGGSDMSKPPVPFFGLTSFFQDVTRAASEMRKLYEHKELQHPFEVLTSAQNEILTSHSEWFDKVSHNSKLRTDLVDPDSLYYMIGAN